MDKSLDTALEALHVAANAIRNMNGIKSATADNDNHSGEIFFETEDGTGYILKLDTIE